MFKRKLSNGYQKIVCIILLFVSASYLGCSTLPSPKPNQAKDDLSMPQALGQFSVGLKKYHFIDPDRRDPILDNQVPRELMVNLYYPADGSTKGVKVPYLNEAMIKFYNDRLPNERHIFKSLSDISTEIFDSPPISGSKESYPIIIFSPGSGVPPEFYSVFIKELVSHGFIVAGINHTYISFVSIFPNGTIKSGDAGNEFRKKLSMNGEDAQGNAIKVVSDDIAQSLDALKQSDMKEHIDFSQLGMMGHSLGGMGVTYQCLNQPSCRAGVNMDGPLLGAASGILHAGVLTGDLNKPFLFFVGSMIVDVVPPVVSTDYKNKKMLDAISVLDPLLSLEEFWGSMRDRWRGRIVRAAKRMGKQTSLISFNNAEHMSFSDWAIIDSHLGIAHKADQPQMMLKISAIMRNFFNKYLKKDNISLFSGVNNNDDFELGLAEK